MARVPIVIIEYSELIRCPDCGGRVHALFYRAFEGRKERSTTRYKHTPFSLCDACGKLFTTIEYRPIVQAARQ